MKLSLMLAIPAIALAMAGASSAEDIEVKMLNKGSNGDTMVFEPDFVKANPGDTIRFIAADKGHNAASIKGGFPEGVEGFKGKINEEYDLKVEKPGLYGVECTPHFGMGMVMVVEVGGDTSNIDALKEAKMPKKARERMDTILAQVSSGDSGAAEEAAPAEETKGEAAE